MLTSNEKQSNGMKGFLPERIDHKFEETCKHLVHGDRIEVRVCITFLFLYFSTLFMMEQMVLTLMIAMIN